MLFYRYRKGRKKSMKNKKNILLLTAGLLGMMIGEMTISTSRAKADNTLTIFENGAFTKEITKHDAGSSIDEEDHTWKNGGEWKASRVLLSEGYDLSSYESLKITYSYTVNNPSSTWITFGLGNAFASGDVHYIENGVSFIADGEEHEISLALSTYFGEDLVTKCTWGTHTDGKLDNTSINSFTINTGNGILKVKKMEAVGGGSSEEKEDISLLKDGTWYSTINADDAKKMATMSFMEDNLWKIRGKGDTLCRVRFNDELNLTGYKRLVLQYKNSSAESIRFGIGNFIDWAYTSAHSNIQVKTGEEIQTASINLVDYDGTAFDKHQWGTPSGNLDLAKVCGFDVLTNEGQNIEIVSLTATTKMEDTGFDPTDVDQAIFDNTKVDEKAQFFNANAYKIGYGTGNWVYVGALDTENHLNENIASRVADGDHYAIQFNNANLIRYDTASANNLMEAMLNNGWLEFDLKFETLPSSNTFKFRLYDGSGLYNERFLVEKDMTIENGAGEWHTYRIAIDELDKLCKKSSWGDKAANEYRYIDMSVIQGFGFLFEQDTTFVARNLHYGYTPVDRNITGIEASTTKTIYNNGEKIDTSTFKVNVLFDDGNKAMNVSNFTVNASGTVSSENKSVDVSFKYNGEKYNAVVDLKVNSATSLVIKKNPDKLEYNEGDAIDLTGIEVEAVMEDGTTMPVNVSDLKVSVDFVTDLDTEIEISYAGASATFTITVKSTGKSYAAFDNSYLNYDDETKQVTAKRGFFLAGNDANSENPTAYFDKVDDKLVMVSNQTVSWRISRFLSSDGVLNLQEINEEAEIFVLVTYRTSEVAKGNFHLFNPVEESDWDQVYVQKEVDFNADGNWHTVKMSLDDFITDTTGHLAEGEIPSNYGMLSPKKLSGFGIGATGKIEIASVSFKWANDMDAKWTDTKGPEITYDGETTFHQKAGEKPHEVKATAYDSHDGEITPTYTWSEGALDANGNLKEGTHTLTISAKDAAGNEAAIRTITYIVEGSGNVDPDPTPDPEPTPTKKGCKGMVVGTSFIVSLLAFAGMGIAFKKKNDEVSK